MPDDRPSPWSTPTDQPAHAWVPSGSYAPAAAAPAPAYAVAAPVPVPAPIEVRLSTPPSRGRSLALAGLAAGGLALLVALGTLVVVLVTIVGPGGGGGYGLRGTVVPERGAVSGPALAEEIVAKIAEDGGEAEDVTCSSSVKVAQDVTAVCHGTDFGSRATFVVFFEDERGAYTLLEL